MQQPDFSCVPSSLHALLSKQWERLQDICTDNADLLTGTVHKELLQVAMGSDFVVDQLVKYPQMLSELIESGVLDRAYQRDEYTKRLAVTIAKINLVLK